MTKHIDSLLNSQYHPHRHLKTRDRVLVLASISRFPSFPCTYAIASTFCQPPPPSPAPYLPPHHHHLLTAPRSLLPPLYLSLTSWTPPFSIFHLFSIRPNSLGCGGKETSANIARAFCSRPYWQHHKVVIMQISAINADTRIYWNMLYIKTTSIFYPLGFLYARALFICMANVLFVIWNLEKEDQENLVVQCRGKVFAPFLLSVSLR